MLSVAVYDMFDTSGDNETGDAKAIQQKSCKLLTAFFNVYELFSFNK